MKIADYKPNGRCVTVVLLLSTSKMLNMCYFMKINPIAFRDLPSTENSNEVTNVSEKMPSIESNQGSTSVT